VQHFVYDLASNSWQAQYFKQMEWEKSQNALVPGPSALRPTFPFLKEVSQNFFVFDVVNLEN